METFLSVVHISTCVILVLVVLVQSGKGAEISASFGGSSQTVFGSSGGANFFTKLTAVLATIFMATSIGLTVLHSQSKKSLFEGFTAPATQTQTETKTEAPAAKKEAPAKKAEKK